MPPSQNTLRATVLAAFVASALSCSRPEVPTSLLDDADLQHVVQLQMARDGAGLARLLRDRRASVRARAAFALASVQDQSVAPALVDALADRDPAVRAEVAFALGQLPLLSGA